MAKKYGGYQYETSPRKLEPEYRPTKKKKKSVQNKKTKQKANVNKNIEKLNRKKVVLYITLAFGVLLVISYRNSQITEKFSEVKNLKNDLAVIQKENEQLEVNVESSINLSTIEKEAEEQLGMKKLDNEQKVYVSLPKKDYVEPATENIRTETESNWFTNFINMILGK